MFVCQDLAGNTATSTVSGINIDKTPLTISGMPSGSSCTLWPPNHKMVRVATVSAADVLSGLVAFSVRMVSSGKPFWEDMMKDLTADTGGGSESGGFFKWLNANTSNWTLPAVDAVIIDTSELNADAAFARALALTRARMQSAPRDLALAALLAGLRRDGRQQSGLDDALLPADADAAYRVAALVERLLDWPRMGWKIAANMPEMQRALRAAEPIMGRVFAPFLMNNPARLDPSRLLHPVVEAEIAICLAADLPPRAAPYTEADILAAIASIHPAIEVAGN